MAIPDFRRTVGVSSGLCEVLMRQLGTPTCSHCTADIEENDTGFCDQCYGEFYCVDCDYETMDCICPLEEECQDLLCQLQYTGYYVMLLVAIDVNLDPRASFASRLALENDSSLNQTFETAVDQPILQYLAQEELSQERTRHKLDYT